MSQYRVAVVGATGAVGTVMLRKLTERGFPAKEIVPFASERSAGRELPGFGRIQPLADETIQGFDIAIFSAGGSTSAESPGSSLGPPPAYRKGGNHVTRWRTTSRAAQPSTGDGASHRSGGTPRTRSVNQPATRAWRSAGVSSTGRR